MIYVEAHKEDAELNELTRGEITYSYDQFSSLVSAKGRDILTVFRTFDEVGNIYGTKDKSDRSYKEGSRLEASGIDLKEKRNVFQGGYGRLVTKGVEYSYDEEGNLVKKREKDGKTWEYMYYGNGMRRKVVRPDKSEVSFGYDAFGRRIEKCITGTGSEKAIRFLWDGNALLHQWEEEADKADKRRKPLQRIEDQAEYVAKLSEKRKQEEKEKAARGEAAPESLVTWIFQDDFVPRARITKEGYSSIITDYLGTPTEAYDGEGSLVWKRELDINGKVMPAGKDRYGKTMEEEGETGFIPFRFQGQYEDEETGLYYNRFRYYDPETGQYTQQDPIGLAGGNPTLYGYVWNPLADIDPWGLANLFQMGTYGELNGKLHIGDGLQAHELIRHEYLVQKGMTSKNVRLSGNPSIALDLSHHTRKGGAHWYEAQIREAQGLGSKQFHSNFKRELDITQGALRKSGVPANRVRKLRKEAEKFYKKKSQIICRG